MNGIQENPKLGFYQVGSKVFYSKPEAYMYATATNQSPKWNFNNLTYAKIAWDVEPELGIRELYRMRAQQLRDRYDYIRVEASGGGDSTTAIFSFLLNGIHLDEVIFRYPRRGEKDVTNDPNITSATNTLSEYQFAAQPLLNWIKTNFPRTIVRIQDYTDQMVESESDRDESWVFRTQDWFQPGHADKHSNFNIKEHKDLAESGKKICALYGIDKPKMTILQGNWYCYFQDFQANHGSPIVGDYDITTELFYWTPDFPEISVKQAHLLRRWFEMPENEHLQYLTKWPNSDMARRTSYEYIAKSIIYPDYDLETWQTSKPTNSFYNEMDYWFYTNFKNTNLYSIWQAGLQLLVDKIDKKYLAYEFGQPVGLEANISPLYWIGASKSVDSTVLANREYVSSRELLAVKQKKLVKILT